MYMAASRRGGGTYVVAERLRRVVHDDSLTQVATQNCQVLYVVTIDAYAVLPK